MWCCWTTPPSRSLPPPPPPQPPPPPSIPSNETVITKPNCKVHLMGEGQALELAFGDFQISKISDGNVWIATTVKVGESLQWPLTKDEPVVKLDRSHYLFSLPIKNGDPLSYGVTFLDPDGDNSMLDKFLKENSIFSVSSKTNNGEIDWKEFAPAVENYNSFLAKAIAGGTGQIIKGIFICTNAYANKVHKGGETMLKPSQGSHETKKPTPGSINKSLKRARILSQMTENMSKKALDVAGFVSSSAMKPVLGSGPAKKFLAMVPGEVVLASLDAVNKIFDAAEAAEKQAMDATTNAVTTAVTNRYGENAGEAAHEAMSTVGHTAGTAWNVFKIRKTINPATSVPTRMIMTATSARAK